MTTTEVTSTKSSIGSGSGRRKNKNPIRKISRSSSLRPTKVAKVSDNASDSSPDLTLRDSVNENESLKLNDVDRLQVEFQQQNELKETNVLQCNKHEVICNSSHSTGITSANSSTATIPNGTKTQNNLNSHQISTSICTPGPLSDLLISLKDGLQKTSEHECTALRLFRRKKTADTSQSGHSSPLSKKSTSLSPLH
jgi:hypothetical protein